MKKQLYIIFSVCLAHGVATQAQLPDVDRGNGYVIGNIGLYRSYERISGSIAYTPYSYNFNGVHWNGSTFKIETGEENFTTSSGSGAIHLGLDTGTPVLLNLKHNLTGRLYFVNRARTGTNNVTMDASQNSTATITGSTSDYRSSEADNAITVFNQRVGAINTVDMTLIEGIYQGGKGYSGMVNINNSGNLTIRGASFLAGAVDEAKAKFRTEEQNIATIELYTKYAAQAGAFVDITGAVVIDNTDGDGFNRFQGASFTSSPINAGGEQNANINASGGDGLYVAASSVNIKGGGEFMAGNSDGKSSRMVNYKGFNTLSATVNARGGRGLVILAGGNNSVKDVRIFGGQASSITIGGANATANSTGGEGLIANGTIEITNVYARAGNSASSTVVPEGTWRIVVGQNPVATTPSSEHATVYASGGSGMRLTGGTAQIWNSTAIGTSGSSINANGFDSAAYAMGGHGVLAQNTDVTINGGTYTGANGGSINVTGSGNADGGAGAYVFNESLTINGGTFTGGAAGSVNGARQMGNIGVWARNANLTINNSVTNTLIKGDVYFNNSTAKNLNILGGTLEGDILINGAGKATVSVSNNANYAGSFIVGGGDVDVILNNETEGLFFSKVKIYDGSTVSFLTNKLVTMTGSSFTLGGSNSVLSFAQGADLSAGSSINAGYGKVKTTSGNLTLAENSSITLAYNGLTGTRGVIDLGGNTLVMTNTSARLNINGVASTSTGSANFVTNGLASSLAPNANIQADLGWMVNEIVDTSAGVKVDWTYNSLTNSSLSDLDHGLLLAVDDILTSTNVTASQFFALNSTGEAGGTQMFRYSLSQLPDVSESSFQVSQQINQQLAARGTEFRSMNGFASTKPSFGKAVQPVGAAGPDGEDQTMQGWVRAYGSFGNRDKTDNFAAYDSTSWGTVVGVDKSFGKLLVGLAGGYARTDLDAGTAYNANVDTYYGSLYSTIGGERIFLDLAATYGIAKTKENNKLLDEGNFDSDILSFYIGGGMSFDVKEKLSITPELSLLTAYYNQESFDRTGITGTGTVQEYDTWSYLGSLGVNFATQHQMDWLNQGLAFIPEVRAHWLHEFNPDPDSFMYSIGGISGPSAVRPRDEDLLRLGVGFDLWNWKYQSTKFELDYDGLFSSTYSEHIFSGKITLQF